MSPGEEDGGLYGAFTLPCRRSHCLSEGLAGLGMPAAPCPAFQGRRAKTTQVCRPLNSTPPSPLFEKKKKKNGRGEMEH